MRDEQGLDLYEVQAEEPHTRLRLVAVPEGKVRMEFRHGVDDCLIAAVTLPEGCLPEMIWVLQARQTMAKTPQEHWLCCDCGTRLDDPDDVETEAGASYCWRCHCAAFHSTCVRCQECCETATMHETPWGLLCGTCYAC